MAYISKAKILFEIMTNSYHSKLTIYYPEFITIFKIIIIF